MLKTQSNSTYYRKYDFTLFLGFNQGIIEIWTLFISPLKQISFVYFIHKQKKIKILSCSKSKLSKSAQTPHAALKHGGGGIILWACSQFQELDALQSWFECRKTRRFLLFQLSESWPESKALVGV